MGSWAAGSYFAFRLWMGFEPQLTGGEGRVDTGFAPPFGFIAMTMELAVMTTAERHGELVADLAAERPALGKAQVMGVGRFATTDQTRLLRHKAHMVAITDAPRLGMRENRFIDRLAAGFLFWFRRVGFRNRLDRLDWRRGFRTMLRGRQPFGVMDGEGLKLGAEESPRCVWRRLH